MSEPSIKKNFAYKSVLTISTYLMNFVTFPYVSRVLGVDGVGLVSFVDNTVNYFLLFASMGVGILGVREVAAVRDIREQRDKVFSNILGLNITFTVLTLFIYFLCVNLIPNLKQYEALFYIGSAKILFTAFLVEWFFTGTENFRYITLRSILVKLLYVIMVFILIRTKEDYILYFVLTVLVVILNACINIVHVRRYVRIQFSELISLKYIKQNVSLGIYNLMTSMYLSFNVIFLGFVGGNVEVGYYTTAFKLYSVILGFFTAFTNVMLPRMTSILAGGDNDHFVKLIDKSFEAICAFSVPMILCAEVLSPEIIYVLSGSGYEGAILPMRIIMPAILFVGVAQVLAVQILIPMRKDSVVLLASIFGAVISLLINVLLVHHIYCVGTAIVLLGSEMTVTLTYIIYVKHKKLFKYSLRTVIRSMAFSLPCVFICYICKIWIINDFLSVGVAGILSLLCWVWLQVRCRTMVGNVLKETFVRKQ